MRVTRHARGLATATLTLAALGLSAGIATAASDQGTAELFPNPAKPGNAVAVNTTFCEGDTAANGNATSVGGGTFLLEPGTRPEVLIGQFTVPNDARVGSYQVTVTCSDDSQAVGTLRVAQTDSTTSPQPTATPTTTTTTTSPSTTASPSGGVSGGIGGPGGNTTAVVAGTSAVVVAVAAGGFWVLRRRNAAGDH